MTADLRALAERAAREAAVCPARREEIAKSIRRHAQPCWACDGGGTINPTVPEIADAIERVARQAVEAEREACAQVCEAGEPREAFFMSIARKHIAADIAREALGEKERQP